MIQNTSVKIFQRLPTTHKMKSKLLIMASRVLHKQALFQPCPSNPLSRPEFKPYKMISSVFCTLYTFQVSPAYTGLYAWNSTASKLQSAIFYLSFKTLLKCHSLCEASLTILASNNVGGAFLDDTNTLFQFHIALFKLHSH